MESPSPLAGEGWGEGSKILTALNPQNKSGGPKAAASFRGNARIDW